MSCSTTANVSFNKKITANVTVGGKTYEWESVNIADSSTSIVNSLFKKKLGPIMFYNGTPIDWQLLGITQDKETGTIDTSAWRPIKGLLRFQYI